MNGPLAVTHLQNFIISDLKNSDTKNDKKRQKTCKFMNKKYLSLNMVTVEEQELHMESHKQRFFTTSKTDRHLLRQKVRQRISVMKTNTGVFVVFKTKRELKRQFSENIGCVCFHY